MPLMLVVVGAILIVAAIRNTLGQLASHLDADLTASQGGVSFLGWLAAIIAVGLLGYIPHMEYPSRLFMGLIVLVIVLKSGTGLFSKFVQELGQKPPQEASTNPAANIPNPIIDLTGLTGPNGALKIQLQGQQKSGAGSAVGVIGGALGL